MVVGAARIELHIHGSQSLKQKRGIVRSIIRRVSNEFNVSIAEVGGQETWQRVSIGISIVGLDRQVIRKRIEKLIDFVSDLHLAEVVGQEIELVSGPLADGGQFDLDISEDRFE